MKIFQSVLNFERRNKIETKRNNSTVRFDLIGFLILALHLLRFEFVFGFFQAIVDVKVLEKVKKK